MKAQRETQLVQTQTSLNLPPLIQEFLAQRGFTSPEAMAAWSYPTLKSIRPPHLLKDMEKACERLMRARERQETIAIYGDYDLDGTSGVALLKTALSDLGFKNLICYQPWRLKEGYGLHAQACEELAQQGASVVLTVDVGITGHQAAERCRKLGVDLIITDHHLPEAGLPPAWAVINPNQEECTSGLGHLCGTGVAFYLCLALCTLVRQVEPELKVQPKSWLDMVAIATITDMVPLIAENRVLVKHGLEVLRRTERAGLRQLLSQLGLGSHPLSAKDVGIGFAPKLNALSRLEGSLRPLEVYQEQNPQRARTLVTEVLSLNDERKRLQAQAERIALKKAEVQASDGGVLWVFDQQIHQGVVGLVATRLSGELGAPAFVGSLSADGLRITGSARRPDSHGELNLVEALSSTSAALVKFGGHAAAAGFELKAERADLFEALLKEYFKGRKILERAQEWSSDLEVELSDLTPAFMRWLGHLEPYGVGFPAPVLHLRQVEIAKAQALKGRHLRFTFLDGPRALAGIWFSPGEAEIEKWRSGMRVDVLGELTVNRFRGAEQLQFRVHDLAVKN